MRECAWPVMCLKIIECTVILSNLDRRQTFCILVVVPVCIRTHIISLSLPLSFAKQLTLRPSLYEETRLNVIECCRCRCRRHCWYLLLLLFLFFIIFYVICCYCYCCSGWKSPVVVLRHGSPRYRRRRLVLPGIRVTWSLRPVCVSRCVTYFSYNNSESSQNSHHNLLRVLMTCPVKICVRNDWPHNVSIVVLVSDTTSPPMIPKSTSTTRMLISASSNY